MSKLSGEGLIMRKVEHILVAVDGSQNSEKALDTAVLLAQSSGAKLSLLYVSYFDAETDDETVTRISWLPDSVSGSSRKAADMILEHARGHIPEGMQVDLQHKTGTPAKVIVDFAEHNAVDMIVVGGRGLGLVEGFLLGSVSQSVMENAKCMVVVVK